MDVLTLALSVVSLILSIAIGLRQQLLARHANLLPVVIELFRESTQPEFKAHMNYIQDRLWKDCPPENFSTVNLSKEARAHFVSVASFYNMVGILVANKVIDKDVPISFMRGGLLRAWSCLAPYIRNERIRRSEPNYCIYFESLAYLALRRPREKFSRSLRLKSMPLDWRFDGVSTSEAPEGAAAIPTPRA
ncbi:DUF4760 domain-containing protein [Micromonospora echinaurantiaca]|uniref:DUF4760 domain-containing protein n=1 Tax=Micromonospora echinaurantiaca TaxID=47857 RepID=UPI00379FF543